MEKDFLQWFWSMFADGLNLFEIIVLLGGVLSVIVGIVKITDCDSRKQGWFVLIMGLFYSLSFFVSGNGLATDVTVACSLAITVILNVLSWVIIYKMKAKSVYYGLLGYFLFLPISFFAGIIDEMLLLSDAIVWQFVILITSLLLESLIAFVKRDSVSHYSGESSLVDDCTDEHNSVDITWMDD